jgi:hypothetical protein
MLLGLLGEAGSGKDTAADWIVKSHNGVKVALADSIKRYCRDAYDFSDDQLWGPSSARNKPDERYPRKHTFRDNVCVCCGFKWAVSENPDPQCFLTPRYALQIAGTEFGRHCFPNTWVNVTLRTAAILMDRESASEVDYDKTKGLYACPKLDSDKERVVVISDVRFKNEVDAIRSEGGVVWKITLPETSSTDGWKSHASEAEMRGLPDSCFDEILVNHKTAFEDLYAAVDTALARSLAATSKRFFESLA